MSEYKVSILLKVIDQATKPAKAINKNFANTHKIMRSLDRPLREVGQRFKSLSRDIGMLTAKFTVLGAATGFVFKRQFIDTAAQFERYGVMLRQLEGSSERASKSMDWVVNFTKNTPFELEHVMESFTKLKSFGLDPANGVLQAISDQTSALGGGREELNGIVLALGQAWSKQKLQGEEALQLIERGVPVWNILADTLGVTTAEVQELSAAGELGQDSISMLIEEMGRRSNGASKEQMKTWAGMMSNLRMQWTLFKVKIMKAGVFELLKEKLEIIGSKLEKLFSNKQAIKEISENVSSLIDGLWKGAEIFYSVLKSVSSAIGGFKNLGIAAIFTGLLVTISPTLVALGGLTFAIFKLAKVAVRSILQIKAATALGGRRGGIAGAFGGGKGKGRFLNSLKKGKIKGLGPISAAISTLSVGSTLLDSDLTGVKKVKVVTQDVSGLAGAYGGAKAGAAAGALLGSFVPIIGNAIGALAGSVVGGIGGYFAGDFIGGKAAGLFGDGDTSKSSSPHRIPLRTYAGTHNNSYHVSISGANMSPNELSKVVVRELERFDIEKVRREEAKSRGILYDH